MITMMSRDRNRRIMMSAGMGVAQRLAQLLTALITLPLALHVLGVAGFGVWGAATSLVWMAGMLDLGLGSALVTLIPRAIAAGRPADAQVHIAAALTGGCLLALAVTVLGGIYAYSGSAPAYGAPFLIAGLGLALNVPLSIASNIWFGLQKGYVAGLWALMQTLLSLGFLLAAAAGGAGTTGMTAAVYGAMVVANAASLAHLLISQRAIRPQNWRSNLRQLRAVFAPGGMLFAIGLAASFAFVFDNLLALDWLGAAASAQMAVALRVCTTADGLLTAVAQPLWPAFVEAAAADDRAWEWRSLRNGSLVVAALAVAGAAVIIVFGAPGLRLWLHQDLHFGPGFFWVMAAWIILISLPRVAGLLLNAVGILHVQMAILTCGTAAAFVFKIFAARHFGAAGILAGAPAAWLLIVVPGFAWRVWRWIARPARVFHGRNDAGL